MYHYHIYHNDFSQVNAYNHIIVVYNLQVQREHQVYYFS